VTVGEHDRATGGDHHPSVYRVVGAAAGVVLLRVTDGDGRRRAIGDLVRVDGATLADEFAVANDPDAGLTPRWTLRHAAPGLY
jgi:hypothetical protein